MKLKWTFGESLHPAIYLFIGDSLVVRTTVDWVNSIKGSLSPIITKIIHRYFSD
jgi:hypothetical protein